MKIIKIFKFSFKNIVAFIVLFIGYFLILFNILLALVFTLISVYIYDGYLYLMSQQNKQNFIEFQINAFIKNMAINCMTNDFNILESLERTVKFLDGEFQKDIQAVIESIKKDYDYNKAFKKLYKKYHTNKTLINFLNNLKIIKEQSNVEQTAKHIFEMASKDSQKMIVYNDKVRNLKKVQLNNYFINMLIGYFVIILVVFSLNVYYVEFARSINGIIINSITIIISQYTTMLLIKKSMEYKHEQA